MNVAIQHPAGCLLSDLLTDFGKVDSDIAVTGISLNSANICPGDVFIALSGSHCHGLDFVQVAIANGAVAVVYDATEEIASPQPIACIAIPDLGAKIGIIGARFYAYPSEQMQVIGITGTNGKTSCSQFLGQVLDHCGIIGTLGWGLWRQLQPTINTTPDALTVQKILAELASQNLKHVAMEVSSHGLVQGRVNGIRFKGAVITNISRDHLDYHGSMAAYVAAKIALLKTPELQYVVLNLDSEYCADLIAATPDTVVLLGISRYGRTLHRGNTLQAENIVCSDVGLQFDVLWQQQRLPVSVSVYGEFNVENILIVLAVLLANGWLLASAVARLQRLQPIPGRMESFRIGTNSPQVFIDYAHSPDALKNVLLSARAYCRQNLSLVFGCGGDRDQGKRPLMGAIAEQYADDIIITDDNPRSENPRAIVNDIVSGCRNKSIAVIHDRESAIKAALQKLGPDDCLIIAGKGHETYQEVAGQRRYFSDRNLLKEIILSTGQEL